MSLNQFSIELHAQPRLDVCTQPLPLQEAQPTEGPGTQARPYNVLSPHTQKVAWLSYVTASVQENAGVVLLV